MDQVYLATAASLVTADLVSAVTVALLAQQDLKETWDQLVLQDKLVLEL